MLRAIIIAGLLLSVSGLHAEAPGAGGPSPNTPAEHDLTVEGARLHYLDEGSGRAVVFVHGNPGSLGDYSAIIRPASRRYRVIAFDRPGHGHSDSPAAGFDTAETQAALLHECLVQLGVRRPVLVGHSWGGALVLAYALQFPQDVSGIVLLAPAAYPEKQGEGLAKTLARVPVVGDLLLLTSRPLVRREIRHGLEEAFAPAPVPPHYLKESESLWARTGEVKAALRDEATLNASLSTLGPKYDSIQLPVIIVTGDSDLIVNPRTNAYALHRAVKGSRLVVLRRTGHEIQLTHPRAVLDAIAAVFQQRRTSSKERRQ